MKTGTKASLAGRAVVTLALGALLLGTAACGAARDEPVDQAELLAIYTARLQREADEFSRVRDEVARSRMRNIALLERSAAETEDEIAYELDLLAWADDGARVELFEAVLTTSDRAVERRAELRALREAQEARIRGMRSRVDVRASRLRAVTRALTDLAAQGDPEFREELAFYRTFFGEVQDALEALEARAAEEARRAVDEAAEAETSPARSGPGGNS